MKRLHPTDRKPLLVDAALNAALAHGYRRMTRDHIAAHASVSPGLVSLYLGTMVKLRRTVMREAIKRGCAEIVAEGLAERDPQALKAPDDLKDKAARLLTAPSR